MDNPVTDAFDGLAAYAGLVRSGEIRALAVTGEKRVELIPEVPTFAEAGYPDLAQPYWYGLFAPAGVPDAVVARILAAARAGLRGDGLTAQMVAQGATMEGIEPAAFEAMLAAEQERWGALIRSIGLRLE